MEVGAGLLAELVRAEIRAWKGGPDGETLALKVARVAEVAAVKARALLLPRRSYINATGIIIHTGWGNAPLHSAARDRLLEAAGASATGAAGMPGRIDTCARLLLELTKAEAATVTTQNAASLLLFAGALASGREIVVAARDLVEISQGARISQIIEATGAKVIPVGSANCVNIEDYKRAIGPQTAIILRSHVSNMATSGFVKHVETPQLAAVARERQVVFVENLGGGSLVDLETRGFPRCPTLQQSIADGADIVLASGDKIIGGPQAGIVVGRKKWVAQMASHALARTCRPSKLELASLEATLALYVSGCAWDEIPTLRLLTMPVAPLRERAVAIAEALRGDRLEASIAEDKAECGGAVFPGVMLPTWTVRLLPSGMGVDEFHAKLLDKGVVARRGKGNVILDLRSLAPEQDCLVINGVNGVYATKCLGT